MNSAVMGTFCILVFVVLSGSAFSSPLQDEDANRIEQKLLNEFRDSPRAVTASGGCNGEESPPPPKTCTNLIPRPFIQSKNSTSSKSGKVVFRDGFWTGKINVDRYDVEGKDYTWNIINLKMENSSSAKIVKDPAGSGQNVVKFTVPDDGKSFRAEIQRKPLGWGHYSYSVSHYIPKTWQLYKYGTILAQWHGYNVSGVSLNPPIALNIFGKENPQWQLHIFRLKPRSSSQDRPQPVIKDCGALDVPVTYNQWHNWNFDITWSKRDCNTNKLINPGLIVVKHNGKEVARIHGENNYHQQSPPYFQMGIYRPGWREGKIPNRPTGGKPVVVYHKGVVIKDFN